MPPLQLPVVQSVPPQQAWPVFPHWQVPPEQVRLLLHIAPSQQGPPEVPQAWQVMSVPQA
jgi:hypothetical protein